MHKIDALAEKALAPLLSLIEKALETVPRSQATFVVVLVVGLGFVYLQQGSANRLIGLGLVIALLLIFMIFSYAVRMYKSQLRYYKGRENSLLRDALRDEVFDRQEERRLIEMINQSFFDDGELRELYRHFQGLYPACTLDYDSLGVTDKLAKVCGLVLYCNRHDAMNQLVDSVHALRHNTRS